MKQIKSSPYRFVNLILFVLASTVNSFPSSGVNAIAPIMTDMFGVHEFYINLNGMVYSILYLIVVFPTNYILQNKGLKYGTLLANLFMIVGLLMQMLLEWNYFYFLAGTFVSGLGFCFVRSAANLFVVTWFLEEQIPLINGICILSIFLSDTISTLVPSLIIHENSTKEEIIQFFLLQNIILVLIQALMAIFFRGKPQNPPNYASETPRDKEYFASIKKLLKNKNYLILFYSMTLNYSFTLMFFIGISWNLKAYGFITKTVAWIFISTSLAGISLIYLTSLAIKKFGYRKTTILCGYGSFVGIGLFILGLQFQKQWVLYIGSSIVGGFVFSYLTTVVDFSSNTTFPISEALSTGFLSYGGHVIGIIIGFFSSLYVFNSDDINKTRIGLAIQIFLALGGFIMLYFSKEELNRQDYEHDKIEQRKSLIKQ